MQAQQWLEKWYGVSASSKTTICRSYTEFKRARTDTEDAERSGWPIEVVTPETIKKVHLIVFGNRKLTLREIADKLKISHGNVYAILHEHLSMRKLLSKWVPRLLTVDQKRQRVVDSERCLELFRRNKPNFSRRYVTMDETWIHHYTPESNRSSAEWTAVGEKRPKRPRTQMWAGKVMALVFWDAHGVLFMKYLEKGKTINSKRYIGQLMRLKNKIGEKRLQMKKKKVLFHQDNAPCQKSLAIMAKLNELSFKLLLYPPYSPDLAPSDYYLLADLKKMLQGKRFYSNEEVITETNAYLEAKAKSFYKKGIEMLEKRWTDCVPLEGDYVDE